MAAAAAAEPSTARRRAADNRPVRPTCLGRCELVRVLGRGAMGVVYEGRDPRLDRSMVVKTILKGHLLDDGVAADSSARFVREAQTVARLAHPHIVTVFDFGEEEEDVAYIVMEFILGRELAARFEAGEFLGLAAAVRILCELLDALGYAHEHGVVHRNVKPANVMLDAAGHVKLTDFGVARMADPGADRTLPGTMVGTPSDMSPEQIQGLAVGSRTDLFAVGVILYQFLMHRKSFAGGGHWTVQKMIVNDDPPAPSLTTSGLPEAFDAVVRRAPAKDPEQRYPTAAAFAADLRRALATAPREDGEATRVVVPARTGVPTATARAEAGTAPTVVVPAPRTGRQGRTGWPPHPPFFVFVAVGDRLGGPRHGHAASARRAVKVPVAGGISSLGGQCRRSPTPRLCTGLSSVRRRQPCRHCRPGCQLG